MSFDISNYRTITEKRLAMLSPVYRKCFAVWCLRAMFELCHSRFAGVLDASDKQFIGTSVDILSRHVITDTTPSIEYLLEIANRCNEVDVGQFATFQNILLAQLLGGVLATVDVFLTHSSKQAMLLAVYIITCIDADVSEREISPEDLSSVPVIASEIRLQEQMICYLQSSPSLSPDDVLRFRQATDE